MTHTYCMRHRQLLTVLNGHLEQIKDMGNPEVKP